MCVCVSVTCYYKYCHVCVSMTLSITHSFHHRCVYAECQLSDNFPTIIIISTARLGCHFGSTHDSCITTHRPHRP